MEYVYALYHKNNLTFIIAFVSVIYSIMFFVITTVLILLPYKSPYFHSA